MQMIEQTILLGHLEDVKAFVAIAMSKAYDIDLSSDRYTVDAKSIMGVFSLDLTKPMRMTAHVERDDALMEQIAKYIYVKE